MKQVVITGMGASTPLGGNLDTTWEALLAGKSGVSRLTDDWAADLTVQIAACLAEDPSAHIERVAARRLDRSTQVALVAATEAWLDAGFGFAGENNVDPEMLAVCVGSGIGGLHSLATNLDNLNEKGPRRVSPFTIPMLMVNAAAANIGLKVNAKAGIHTPVSACASGNEAIGLGLDLIRLGRADVVVVGGTEATIHPLPLAAFNQMQALSRRNDEPERASRPWDIDRDGFVLGEGAGILVLESLEHAKARGARIYGTLAGVGTTADSHDIVQPEPSGSGQSGAMKRALSDAGLAPVDIVHVNAHATSTPQGDVTEAGSIRLALGKSAENAVVTGTKSMTGHLLGAAGAIETIFTTKALYHRKVPGTINLENVEPDLDIDIATNTRELPSGPLAAINNSFGFGGHNIAIAITNEHI